MLGTEDVVAASGSISNRKPRPFNGPCQWCNGQFHTLAFCPTFKHLYPKIDVPLPHPYVGDDDDRECQIGRIRAMELLNNNRDDEYPIKILIKSRSYPDADTDGDKKEKYCTTHQLVDLNSNHIQLRYTPSTIQFPPFSLSSVCYDFTLIPSDPVKCCNTPLPLFNTFSRRCICLFDKLYFFGPTARKTEVLDLTVRGGGWKPVFVPDDLLDSRVRLYPVPDPCNCRILVVLDDDSKMYPLFAFCPEAPRDKQWQLIAQKFYDWDEVAAVVDNVLYFHRFEFRPSFRAFDLVKGEWLKVCEVDKSIIRNHSTALFHLGGNVICLAFSMSIFGDNNPHRCQITFSKLIVERSGETVTISHGISYSYIIPATISVQGFLPIYM